MIIITSKYSSLSIHTRIITTERLKFLSVRKSDYHDILIIIIITSFTCRFFFEMREYVCVCVRIN